MRYVQWTLDDEGGGDATVREPDPEGNDRVTKYVFDSLDDPRLPRDVAMAIRIDGGRTGKLTLP